MSGSTLRTSFMIFLFTRVILSPVVFTRGFATAQAQQTQYPTEANLQRCSEEKVFWKYVPNLQENTSVEVALQLYWNYTSAWVNLLHILRTPFPQDTSGELLPTLISGDWEAQSEWGITQLAHVIWKIVRCSNLCYSDNTSEKGLLTVHFASAHSLLSCLSEQPSASYKILIFTLLTKLVKNFASSISSWKWRLENPYLIAVKYQIKN